MLLFVAELLFFPFVIQSEINFLLIGKFNKFTFVYVADIFDISWSYNFVLFSIFIPLKLFSLCGPWGGSDTFVLVVVFIFIISHKALSL